MLTMTFIATSRFPSEDAHLALSPSPKAMRTPARAPIESKCYSHETRARISMRLLAVLVLFALVVPTSAADNDLYASFRNPTNHSGICWTIIGPIVALPVLLGHYVVAYYGRAVAPSMGFSSVLWLLLRNDPAVDPKGIWLLVPLDSDILYGPMPSRHAPQRIHLGNAGGIKSLCLLCRFGSEDISTGWMGDSDPAMHLIRRLHGSRIRKAYLPKPVHRTKQPPGSTLLAVEL
ncbi:hypothetical protein CC86DRAFT_417176 [Ophiobolus disseminans]|uniref:Uncharacterized protein n=1 Tax=Ophiobolus disseminans TaxID=1469910 RepID=A0A6A7A0C8_9PLEO|nr:hypothetical protein CC86DRAFT_417176 [Ophiobolus disseminans]